MVVKINGQVVARAVDAQQVIEERKSGGALSLLCKAAAVTSAVLLADPHAALAAEQHAGLVALHKAQLWVIVGGAFVCMAGGFIILFNKKWGVRAFQASGVMAATAVAGPIALIILTILGFWGLDKLFEVVQSYTSGGGAGVL